MEARRKRLGTGGTAPPRFTPGQFATNLHGPSFTHSVRRKDERGRNTEWNRAELP